MLCDLFAAIKSQHSWLLAHFYVHQVALAKGDRCQAQQNYEELVAKVRTLQAHLVSGDCTSSHHASAGRSPMCCRKAGTAMLS